MNIPEYVVEFTKILADYSNIQSDELNPKLEREYKESLDDEYKAITAKFINLCRQAVEQYEIPF